ncbi:hypothetical protein NSTC731_03335 [Nostoc sp. DSM 114167]|jgi:hypothetical protein
MAPDEISVKKDLPDHLSLFNYFTPKARCKNLHLAFLYEFFLKKREFDKSYLTSPPTPLRHGEGSKKLNFSLLLPLGFGEGGWEGEIHRTHVKEKGVGEMREKNY